jgi:hypothetical protein
VDKVPAGARTDGHLLVDGRARRSPVSTRNSTTLTAALLDAGGRRWVGSGSFFSVTENDSGNLRACGGCPPSSRRVRDLNITPSWSGTPVFFCKPKSCMHRGKPPICTRHLAHAVCNCTCTSRAREHHHPHPDLIYPVSIRQACIPLSFRIARVFLRFVVRQEVGKCLLPRCMHRRLGFQPTYDGSGGAAQRAAIHALMISSSGHDVVQPEAQK